MTDQLGDAARIGSLGREVRNRSRQGEKHRTYLSLECFGFKGLNNKARKFKNLAGRGRQTRDRSRRRFGRCSVRIVVHLHGTLTKEEAVRKPIIEEIIRECTGPEL